MLGAAAAVTLLKRSPEWSDTPWRRGDGLRYVAEIDDLAMAIATAIIGGEEIERVIIEPPVRGSSIISLLTRLPADFTAEIFIITSPERGFVSRNEQGKRSLYLVQPETYLTDPAAERLRVLIAEDERKTREHISTVVESVGGEPLPARAGAEAIRIATSNRPQLLLLDGLLPEMAGFEVSRFVRSMDASYHPRIVMVTAVYKDNRYRSEAKLKYGVDNYLVKPVTRDQIADEIFGGL